MPPEKLWADNTASPFFLFKYAARASNVYKKRVWNLSIAKTFKEMPVNGWEKEAKPETDGTHADAEGRRGEKEGERERKSS
ncbi:hypothetical protein KEJ32_02560 [Candidatus Bathyarchaeota archaeon]|nr:hypothetical protein [Candidatus Bathyarchaeota archaeon]MBS7636609.1 hypothetical protein [Candidatus Bathyarchaeota archaeon]